MKRVSRLAAIVLTAGLAGGLLVAAGAPALGASSPGIITTVAGGPGRGPATTVAQYPLSVLAGPGGAVYVGDIWAVRELAIGSSSEQVLAGLGTAFGVSGNGRLATQAVVNSVNAMALDAAGNLVIRDGGDDIQVVAAQSGTFYGQAMTAGHLYAVPLGQPFSSPAAMAIDSAGNVLIAGDNAGRVRVLAVRTGTFYGQAMTAGDTYTIAGTGNKGGYNGDGIPALSAELNGPQGLAIDSAGNVIIADTYNNRIRVIAASSGTFYGQAMTAGDIYTIAGQKAGHTGDGGPAILARLDGPEGVTFDAAGNMMIADTTNERIRVIAKASGDFYGRAMTAGDIYTIAGNGTLGYNGDGIPALSAEFDVPQGLTIDSAGNVVVADTYNFRVRVIAATSGTFYGQPMTAGDIYTVAGTGSATVSGDGGPAGNAELDDAGGLATEGSGNVVIADDYDQIRVVAARNGTLFGRLMAAGDIYTVAGNGTEGYSGDGGPGTAAELGQPGGPATDRAGNVLFAEQYNSRVRVVAAVSGTFYGQAMTVGDIYTIAGNGIAGYSGDGGPATSAELSFPAGVAVDAHGNVLINDTGNARIRVVAAAAGTFYGQVMTAGDIYTIAGNGRVGYNGDGIPALSAELDSYGSLAVDEAGNVLIPDSKNNRLRVIAAATGTFYGQPMTAGDIYTIAGNGTSGYSGDGGQAVAATLNFPMAATVDAAGNVLIADSLNNRVRVIAAATGTFYGQPMTAGDIYTIAGDGKAGFAGDGKPGSSARLTEPVGVAVNGAGNALIADSGNNRVRQVAG